MKHAGLTKQERSFIALMRILAALFIGTGFIFAASPYYLPNYVTKIGTEIFGWRSPPLDFGTESFFIVPAVALLFAFAYLCIIAQRNLVRNIGYARPVILAKFFASLGFATCFFLYGGQFIYLVAAATDFFIFLMTWRFYSRALRSRA